MLAAQRQTQITRLVQSHGAVSVSELVRLLGVSDMTIRRDLDALASQGEVLKVHGGAVSTGPRSAEEPTFDVKAAQMEAEKIVIAEAAAKLVTSGMSVALSAGTTTWALARLLLEIEDLTVITNSTRISDILHENPRQDRTVILTGGVRTRSNALVGPTAVAALRSLHVDLAFLGTHGISTKAGCTTPNFLEAETNRALFDSAQRTAVLADHTKWAVVGVMTFAMLEDIDVLIMDDALDHQAEEALRDRVGELRLVESPRGGRP